VVAPGVLLGKCNKTIITSQGGMVGSGRFSPLIKNEKRGKLVSKRAWDR